MLGSRRKSILGPARESDALCRYEMWDGMRLNYETDKWRLNFEKCTKGGRYTFVIIGKLVVSVGVVLCREKFGS